MFLTHSTCNTFKTIEPIFINTSLVLYILEMCVGLVRTKMWYVKIGGARSQFNNLDMLSKTKSESVSILVKINNVSLTLLPTMVVFPMSRDM